MGRHVIELDVVHSEDGRDAAHVHVQGLVDAEGPILVLASRTKAEGCYTLAENGVPAFKGRDWRTLCTRIARHYGLSGSVRVENEVTGRVTTFDV